MANGEMSNVTLDSGRTGHIPSLCIIRFSFQFIDPASNLGNLVPTFVFRVIGGTKGPQLLFHVCNRFLCCL